MIRIPSSLLVCALTLLAGCTLSPKPSASATAAPPNAHTDAYPPLPEGITSFGAAVNDGWLYVFGGYTGQRHDYCVEKVRGTFYRINLAAPAGNRVWEPLPASEPAQGTAIVAWGQAIYRVGGMAAKNHEGEPQDLLSQTIFERYDIGEKTWKPLPSLPAGRSTHDAMVVGDKLYVGGGWDLNGNPFDNDHSARWHDTVLVADLSRENPSWQSIPQPFKRRAIAMATLGSKIYFIGGMDSHNDPSRAVDTYDTGTGRWGQGPDLPAATMNGFGFAATTLDGAIYASGFSGVLLRLSADGTRWETVRTLNHPRFFHRLMAVGNHQLLALGGEGKSGKLRDNEILSP